MSPTFPPPDDEGLLAAGRRALRELTDAPEWMILRAEALGVPRVQRAPSLFKRVQALLSVDSWAGAMPALRGVAGTRQMLFSAAEHDLDLRVLPLEAVSYTHLDVYKRQPTRTWPHAPAAWPRHWPPWA